jgi:hypothetical protein
LQKLFDMDFFCKTFFVVFEFPSLSNTWKRNQIKKVEEKLSSKYLSRISIF